MRLFGVFRKKKRKEIDAARLLHAARACAIASYIRLLDEYPDLKEISETAKLRQFDLLAAVAVIGTAAPELSEKLNKDQKEKLLSDIHKVLLSWEKESPELFDDFTGFLESRSDNEDGESIDELAEAVGSWIFSQLHRRNSSNDNLHAFANSAQLAFALGNQVVNKCSGYWQNY